MTVRLYYIGSRNDKVDRTIIMVSHSLVRYSSTVISASWPTGRRFEDVALLARGILCAFTVVILLIILLTKVTLMRLIIDGDSRHKFLIL